MNSLLFHARNALGRAKRWRSLVFLGFLVAGLGTVQPVLGQGSGIAYQGQLTQAGVPAEGKYDLRATLYSAANGGAAIGATLTLTAVDVHRGVFTVNLDFGAGAFNGQPRWLDLAVRPASGGAYTPLAPRQALNAVPYALYAMTPAGPQGERGPKGDKGEKGDPGPSRLSDTDLFLRSSGDNFHGIGWFGESKPFGSETPDGPVVYGFSGGALGSHNNDGTQVALRWTRDARVAIGAGTKPANAPLHVAAEGGSGDQFILGSPKLENGDTTLVMGLTAPKGGNTYLQAIAATGQSYGDLLANPDGGNVGIRTRTPTAELEVNGTAKAKRFEGDGSGLSNVPGTLQSATGVVAWGFNGFGQTTVPPSLKGVIALAMGANFTTALMEDGTVTEWGANRPDVVKVPSGLSGVTAIDAGSGHTVVLKSDGTVVAWGSNQYGQTNVPPQFNGVTSIAGGAIHTIVAKSDGTCVAWGNNQFGQGVVPPGVSEVVAVAAGHYHSVALKRDGTVVAWGSNIYGQTNVPVDLRGVTAIAAGGWHTMVLKSDGTVLSWGHNEMGQTQVPAGLRDVVAIAAGDAHSVALKADGTVVGWGAGAVECEAVNFGHCINIHAFTQSMIPKGVKDVIAIAAGGDSTAALWRKPAVLDDLVVTGSVTAQAFNTTSDRNVKERCTLIDPQAVLAKVAALPISEWNFKGQPGERHIGPMAQDFHAAFGLGTDDRHIATVDADGVALAAIQGLNRRFEGVSRAVADTELGFRTQIDALRQENAELRDRLARFEALLRTLPQRANPDGDR